ncbi:MAG: SphA family protein [Rhodoferax sp.]
MKNAPNHLKPLFPFLKAASCLTLIATGLNADAAEGYRLRQAPVGSFGGEIAAPADNPGLFGTALLTFANIYKVVDGAGDNIALSARTVPLPTGGPTGGAVPSGTYSLSVPAGTIDFNQKQTQLNLMGGYLTKDLYGDGRLAFAINVPLIKMSRTFIAVQPAGTVSPPPPAAMPPALRGAIAAVAAAVNNQVQAGVASTAANQNADVSGFGDTELSMVWVRHQDRLKVAAGVSLFVPTGAYDKTRGPNPGYGNFYTLRPGMAMTYSLNPNHTASGWDAGVTVAGRLSFGLNTANKDTDYRSGNFVYGELGVVKVMGDWAIGTNLLTTQQVTDDSGAGAPADGSRYRTWGIGPFLSYKLPGKDAGFNLQYSDNFAASNALVVRALQLRFVKAW